MRYSIETRFAELIRRKEREIRSKIDIVKLSDEIGVSAKVLEQFENSHIEDVSSIPIIEFIKVADYFGKKLSEFVIYNSGYEVIEGEAYDEVRSEKANNPTRAITGEAFKDVLHRSKYFEVYNKVPTLLDEVARKIDQSNGKIVAGVVNNFNLKLIDENVIIRFFCSKNKIFIKNNLFGKSISMDKKEIYKHLYDEYRDNLKKDTVDTADDVELLMGLVDKYVQEDV